VEQVEVQRTELLRWARRELRKVRKASKKELWEKANKMETETGYKQRRIEMCEKMIKALEGLKEE